MTKTVLMFAGQGAQTVGMGRDLAEQFPAARALFDRSNEALGYDLAHVCFHGPEPELTRTENAQPGIYLVSWVALELLRLRVPNLRFEATAGLSLGEFTALAAAGAMAFEDGLRLTRWRGQFMQAACDATQGGMAAILGLSEPDTRAVCQEAGVELANLNCPGQYVISGETARIPGACDLAKTRGAKRAVPLQVAGAYHSSLMRSAQPPLADQLKGVSIHAPKVPVISNVTARPHDGPDQIRELLVQQVCAPVRWEDSIRFLVEQGATRFIELGPGKTLCGFLKRIAPGVEAYNVADAASLESTAAALQGG